MGQCARCGFSNDNFQTFLELCEQDIGPWSNTSNSDDCKGTITACSYILIKCMRAYVNTIIYEEMFFFDNNNIYIYIYIHQNDHTPSEKHSLSKRQRRFVRLLYTEC